MSLRLAVVAGALALAGCSQGDDATTDNWTADIAAIDCCATTRAPSPDSTRTLIFEPGADGKARVRLSAGWLRQEEVAVASLPAAAAWAPDGRGFFISESRGPGETSRFRLFRTPENGAPAELSEARGQAVAAYRTHAGCADDGSDPALSGLGWSRDGRRVLVRARSATPGSCGPGEGDLIMALAAEDGRVLERYEAAEAAARFAALIPAAGGGVTAP